MELDPQNQTPTRSWTEASIQPEDMADTWTGTPSQDDNFDPEMFTKGRKNPTDPDRPYNWMEVGIRPNNYDDDTWSGGAGLGTE